MRKQLIAYARILAKFQIWILDTKMTSLNERIDSLRNENKVEISGVRNEMASLRTEMNIKFDSLEKRIPVIEKITAPEIKIADIEKRLAAA